jgi:hypothetical protein
MTTPTITLYPDTLPAKGQANAPFDVNVDNFLTWLTATNGPELATLVTWTQGVADTVLATALAGNLPALTGKAGNYIRANDAEDGGQFRTPAQILTDISAAPLESPPLTGIPTAPTAAASTTTAAELNYIDGVTSAIQTQMDAKAPLDAPDFTGIPTAPTAAASTNTTQLATTAQVRLAIPDVLNAGGSAPVYGCRAWVNFNGSGVVAIRGSGNVSSITDNGIGDYTINLATALTDVNYSLGLACRNEISTGDTAINVKQGTTPTASAVTISCSRASSGQQDPVFVYAQFFR